MNASDLEKKVVSLEKDLESIKTSQILGGANTKVYHKYVEGRSCYVRFGGQAWANRYWYSEDGIAGGSQFELAFANLEGDPFELIEVEKVEIWRDNTKLLTGWGNLTKISTRGTGQLSSTGDMMQMKILRSAYYWQTGTLVGGMSSQAPMIQITMLGGPGGCLTDNPPTPFRYVVKLWIRSTSRGEFQCTNGF